MTSASFTLSGVTDQTITYTYDTGTNQKGHLTGASDANHSLAWAYDTQGRITGKGQTVGGTTLALGYGYNASGQLSSTVLPSGATVGFGYNANGQVTSLTLNGATTILSGITYDPFGPITGWSWGNGTSASRAFDTDGKITQMDNAGGASLKNFSYDDAFRITGIADAADSTLSWTYGYDLLDRLNAASKTGTTQGWTYDANGNRLTETGTSPSTYTNSGTSNRVSSISGALARTYGYDNAGNTLSYGGATFTYNNRGRMVTATNGSATATYAYNALGQRIKRTAAGVTTLYVYDEAGHLTGEYTSAGALIQETVWLGDTPIATLRPNGSGGVILYYVHADHLNTPRLITDTSNNVRWRWDSDPFGTTIPNEDPSSLGVFSFNLRFPGQQYDAVVGLHYNYFRDYDPAVGRYVESDPIGLLGGNNTFGYAFAEPMSSYDPEGLHAVAKTARWVLKGAKRLGIVSRNAIPLKTAILLRKAGKEVCIRGGSKAERRKLAEEIETRANGKDDLIEHPKDSHKNSGNQSHFQTDGVRGHTFYTVVGALSATTYLGDGFWGNAIDFLNPLSLGKDALDIYDEFSESEAEACECESE